MADMSPLPVRSLLSSRCSSAFVRAMSSCENRVHAAFRRFTSVVRSVGMCEITGNANDKRKMTVPKRDHFEFDNELKTSRTTDGV